MGSPVSPVVANIYMEMLEDLALKTKLAPKIWKRYVDDTFRVIEKVNARYLLNHLNSLCHSIQFTIELEKDRSLPFLDTLLTRRENGRTESLHIQTDICTTLLTILSMSKGVWPMPVEFCQNSGYGRICHERGEPCYKRFEG